MLFNSRRPRNNDTNLQLGENSLGFNMWGNPWPLNTKMMKDWQKTLLPMQVMPSMSRVKPAVQSQVNPPSVLVQIMSQPGRPLQVHVLVPTVHSSTSTNGAEKTRSHCRLFQMAPIANESDVTHTSRLRGQLLTYACYEVRGKGKSWWAVAWVRAYVVDTNWCAATTDATCARISGSGALVLIWNQSLINCQLHSYLTLLTEAKNNSYNALVKEDYIRILTNASFAVSVDGEANRTTTSVGAYCFDAAGCTACDTTTAAVMGTGGITLGEIWREDYNTRH